MWGNRKAKIARRFVEALCAGDAATVDALMAQDIVYTDGRGNHLEGFAACSAAARAFHALDPNFRFVVTETTVRRDKVLFRGMVEGDASQVGGELLIYIALSDGKVREYQVHRYGARALAPILAGMS